VRDPIHRGAALALAGLTLGLLLLASTSAATEPPTYALSVHETGLPAGISWGVDIQGTTHTSKNATVVVTEPPGVYTVTPLPGPGLLPNQSSYAVTITDAPVTLEVVYSPQNSSGPGGGGGGGGGSGDGSGGDAGAPPSGAGSGFDGVSTGVLLGIVIVAILGAVALFFLSRPVRRRSDVDQEAVEAEARRQKRASKTAERRRRRGGSTSPRKEPHTNKARSAPKRSRSDEDDVLDEPGTD
jgi:hypothetical protein